MRLSLTSGLTLFEVLLSLLLLSTVLLGLEATELAALRLHYKAYFSSLAEQQLHSLQERLRLLGSGPGLDAHLAAWTLENQRLLPHSASRVAGLFPHYTLTLCWREPSEEKDACLHDTWIF